MQRRSFIKKTAFATAGAIVAPYILPTGRLFAATGTRIADHVVFVLFAGGLRNQESVYQQYLSTQGLPTQGNVMENMLNGAAPSSNLVYNRWPKVIPSTLQNEGTLFREVRYAQGNTGHYNAHAVAMTGSYLSTGVNDFVNPSSPTLFEYYRKHNDPAKSAINAWWLSEGLGPFPALNYSKHAMYGSPYGANYFNPQTTFLNTGPDYLSGISACQPCSDNEKISKIKNFLNNNFDKSPADIPGIQNTEENRQALKQFITDTIDKTQNNGLEWATPGSDPNLLTGDLINISYSWEVFKTFKPELMVINTFNLDVCHDEYSQHLDYLHRADYGVAWLWNKIKTESGVGDNTIMICMPEHGRNLDFNSFVDGNGLRALDHTGDDNSRKVFTMITGPAGKVVQNQTLDMITPLPQTVDIVPTIAHILGFQDKIPSSFLDGRVLTEAFV